MKRILLLSSNFYPEPTGIGKYNGEMIDWLSSEGNECAVITTYPYYPFWKVQAPYQKKCFWYRHEQKSTLHGTPVKLYRCPHYVPKIPSGKKRILSDLSFSFTAFFMLITLLFKKKYDHIIAVAPSFHLGILALFYRYIRGAEVIYHIQDLQIDTAYELGMIKRKTVIQLLFHIEKVILKKADYVSSISEGMIEKIKTKYQRNVILFPNWTDTQAFFPIQHKEDIRKEFDFSVNDKIILYAGSIGEKQGLDSLLYCAKELSIYKEIKFIICGSSPNVKDLIDLAKRMSLSNVIFTPLQPKEKFNRFLNLADVHVILQRVNINDLVMPSKLTTILSVGGLALVTAQPETGLCSLIKNNKIGIVIEPGNQTALTNAIVTAINHQYTAMKNNARAFAEAFLSTDKLLKDFFSKIISPEDKPLQGVGPKNGTGY